MSQRSLTGIVDGVPVCLDIFSSDPVSGISSGSKNLYLNKRLCGLDEMQLPPRTSISPWDTNHESQAGDSPTGCDPPENVAFCEVCFRWILWSYWCPLPYIYSFTEQQWNVSDPIGENTVLVAGYVPLSTYRWLQPVDTWSGTTSPHRLCTYYVTHWSRSEIQIPQNFNQWDIMYSHTRKCLCHRCQITSDLIKKNADTTSTLWEKPKIAAL
jgi:hypothetical protein